jgi:hypothetical protein
MSSSSRTSSNPDFSQSEWQKGDLKQNERKKAHAYWSKHLKGNPVQPYQDSWIGTATRHLLVHLATKNQRWLSVLTSKFPDDIPKYLRLKTWVYHRALQELPPDQIIHGHPEPYQVSRKVTNSQKSDQPPKVTKSTKSDQLFNIIKSDQVEKVTKSDQPDKIL